MQELKILFLGFVCLFINLSTLSAQTISIKGVVSGADDLENIHVINKTSKTFTITDNVGHFEIAVKLGDTLVFSSLQYIGLEIVIDATRIENKAIAVNLEEYVNKLDEVVVGKVLTGNLMLDIGSSTVEPDINFYDVGIPGYMGKRKTKAERDLFEAGEFKPIMFLGLLGGSMPLNPIINGLSGRTKKLKKRIAFESNNELINKIRQRFSLDFFSEHSLSEFRQMDFWYFCSDAPDFEKRCGGDDDAAIIVFLNLKYHEYLANVNSTSN